MTRRATVTWLPDYDVSDTGEVRRITPASRHGEVPYALRGSLRNGYRACKLVMQDGSQRWVMVHRFVCEAFHGPAPDGKPQAAHWDGDKLNNAPENLRWASPKENIAYDKKRHGTDPVGGRHPRSILSEEAVCEIRSRYTGKRGEQKALAREYGLSKTAFRNALFGITWTHVQVATNALPGKRRKPDALVRATAPGVTPIKRAG